MHWYVFIEEGTQGKSAHTRLLAEAWEKWHHELVRTRKALKAATKWVNNALARGWRAWIWRLKEQNRLRVVATKVRRVCILLKYTRKVHV